MKRFLTGLAALAIASVAQAQAADPMKPDTMKKDTTTHDTMKHDAIGTNVELSGVVSSVDKSAKSLTVVAPLRERAELAQIGDAFLIDEQRQLVAVDGAYDPKATITRDGKIVKWSDLKEGDIIRTSFDPETNMFAGGTVTSKDAVKKELKKEIKELKKDIKSVDEMAK